MDALGGISRLDYFILTYTFTSSELSRKKASLIACCVVESSAVVKDIDANTLRVIVSRAFKGGNIPHSTLTAIYAQLISAINAPVNRFEFSSLSAQEKEDLENWYKPTSQQKGFQPNGGLITYQQDGAVNGGEGDGSFPATNEFMQSGFKPADIAA